MIKFVTATIRTLDNKKDIKGYIYLENFDASKPYIVWKNRITYLSECVNVEVRNKEVNGIMGDLDRYTKVYVTPDSIGLDAINILHLNNSLVIYNKRNVNGEVIYDGIYGIDRANSSYSGDLINEYFNSDLASSITLANVKYSNGTLMGIGWSLDNNPFIINEKSKDKNDSFVDIIDDIYWKNIFEEMSSKSISYINQSFKNMKDYSAFKVMSKYDNMLVLSSKKGIEVKITPIIKFDSPERNGIKIIFKLSCLNLSASSLSKGKKEKYLDTTFHLAIAQLEDGKYNKKIVEALIWKDCRYECDIVVNEVYNILMKKFGSLYSII